MFTNSKPFFGLKKSSMGIFRIPVCQSVSISTTSSGIIATSSRHRLSRRINSLATGAQIRPSEDSSSSQNKNNTIIEKVASFRFPSNLFPWRSGSEKQKRMRFKKVISSAEDLLKIRNNSWIKSLHAEPSTQIISNSKDASQPQLTLQSLFDNQATIISSYIQQLMHSNHPILNYARNMFSETSGTSAIQLRSIAVLLVAKAIGFPIKIQSASVEIQDDIEARQRRLSEITELIYAAHLLHRTVVEIPDVQSSNELKDTSASGVTEIEVHSLHQGNKLATLMGDFLLAKSSKGLANLKNAKVTELMSDTIADISESEFISRINSSRKSILGTEISKSGVKVPSLKPSEPFLSYDNWLQRTNLSVGSLLGYSCYCTMVFSGQEDPVRQLAFHLGSKIALVLQAYKDLSFFVREDEELSSQITPQYFDLLTLPVIFHLEENPSLMEGKVDYAKIYEEVKTSHVAINKTRETLQVFQQSALRLISQLPQSETSPASKLLSELVLTLS